jgi:broad specificity phosphatase PhoE
MKRLLLVRHGETEDNIRGINRGQGHGKLTRLGREQARQVALRLKDEPLDVIYSSDLKRALDTAKAIRKFHPKTQFIIDKRLREMHQGIYEGKPKGRIHAKAKEMGIPFIKFKPRGGESVIEMKKRVLDFLHEVQKKEKGKRVLFVAHGGTICNLLLHVAKKDDSFFKKYHPGNTGVSIVEFSPKGKEKIALINCTKHLK